MRTTRLTCGLSAVLFACAGACLAAPAPVSKPEQAQWLRWLIPLPKQISIGQKLDVAASDVKLILRKAAGEVEQCAADELRELFKDKAKADLKQGRFEILMGVCDAAGKLEGLAVPGAADLAKLPNAEQAYVIRPIGEARLALAALNERGVYYAAQTLKQLLAPRFSNGRVTLPIAAVTDWPDLAERGEWGGSANNDIVWMSRLKMNVVESHVSLSMGKDGRGTAQANQELIDLGRRRALKFVPIITHLNGLRRTLIYDHYPQLAGKGEGALLKGHDSLIAPCCADPKIAEVFADWMIALASHPGVTDVCAWLTECRQYCSCEQCTKVGQWAFETRRLVEGYRIAQKKCPHFKLRILLTQASYSTNDKVLAEVPPDVYVSYYDGGRTYDSSRDPMIYPLLEEYAAKGLWLGCYPQLTASWRIVCPWSGPQFMKYRMTEFVGKKLTCLAGYATPNNKLYEFNVTAAAEWSWNSGGRDEREYALAYWTRKRVKDPEAAADWAVMLGPVGWDVYGSRIPAQNFFGRAAGLVASRGMPKLGEKGMFRYFPTPEHIDHDLAVCDQAMAIAKRLDEPIMILETQVIQGYVQMVKAIYEITTRVSKSKLPAYPERVTLQKALASLMLASTRTSEALKKWDLLCGDGVSIGSSRIGDTVDVTEKTAIDIGDSLVPIGLRNPIKPYLRSEIGKWVTTDFDKGGSITKTFDVTDCVCVPGAYQVGFKYTSGWNGLSIYRVALASGPEAEPTKLTELSVDEHRGSAAHRNKDNVFSVKLAKHDPAAKYFVVAKILGTCQLKQTPGRKGCNGTVWMQTKMPDNWREMIDSAKPLTDEELAAKQSAKFKGKGLRVGVLQGGYGAAGILKALRKTKGVDAQPVGGLYANVLKQCQVVLVAQPKGASMGAEVVKAVEAYVRAGGGLITTHDAVGYRGLPPMITDVCAKGIEHVRDPQWVAALKHPLTQGIALNTPLPHGYYDHIELAAGPKGTVVCKAAKSGRPVVVCGEYGKGRYVACGLAIGLNAMTEDEPPTGAEKALLENAIRWCGGK